LLDRLFREALRVGRKVRAQSGDRDASVAAAAAVLAERVLGDLTGRRVLLVGAGATAQQAGERLRARGAEIVCVANRGVDRAARVARRFGAAAAPLDAVPAQLPELDVVVCATRAPTVVIERSHVELALAERERRPLLLLDLAVPRDVDPSVRELPYAFLYDLDELDEVVRTAPVRGAAARAEALVAEEAERFRAWQASRGVVPALAALRARAEEIRARELARAARRFEGLSPAERRAVEAVTAQIVNKLLHEPTIRLKDDAADADGALYADAVRHLFALDADQARIPRE
jgi:glutamyl-tRNA reductase